MENGKPKIKSFTDLNTWKEGYKLVLAIYKISDEFPEKEVFGITSQMRRCAVSITSNVAEGFSRNTIKDKCQFYSIAQGSLMELQNQLLIARDVGYINNDEFQKIARQTVAVNKLVSGLEKIRNTKY